MKTNAAVAAITLGALAGLATAQPSEPASVGIAAFSGNVENDRVIIKLMEGTDASAMNGQLVTRQGAALSLVGRRGVVAIDADSIIASWSRLHWVDDAALEAERQVAQQYWGRALPDLRLTFTVTLKPGVDLEAAIDALRQLPQVEYAMPVVKPVASPVPGSFVSNQGYLNTATTGIGASAVHGWPGGTGNNVRICDVEYSWNTAHQDLPAVTHLGPAAVDPFNDKNHGTAVLGEMGSRNNGWGTTGAVYNSLFRTAAANTSAGYNVASAITVASNGMGVGDVILIEQQTFGPNGGQYVPCEWNKPVYDAIVQAVGNGRIVVEAAGNGGQNLDSSLHQTGNGGHYPFLLANDSGAIIVGAGAAPSAFGGSTTDRSRLGFSCYGATVDLQGWGERVTTCGYGGFYSAEGTNLWYTNTFNGTSSASPIVASACAALQSIHEQLTGSPLTPAQIKSYLVATGSAQQSGANPASQNIGPRPNVPAAVALAFGNKDCNGNNRPDKVDIGLGSSADTNANGIPDECESCPADFDGTGFVDTEDYDAFVQAFEAGTINADFDGSGFVDIEDFSAFVVAFEAGC
jgi:serine protease